MSRIFFPGWRRGKTGPWLVHRLDRDTAGCLVIALKKAGLLAAQQLFADHLVQKTYWALVVGRPTACEGEIDLPLVKTTMGNKAGGKSWKMVGASDPANAPAARTSWRLRGGNDTVSWLELHPFTGPHPSDSRPLRRLWASGAR